MSKAKTKHFILLDASDFPYDPTTSELITGIKSMALVEPGYELTKYLEKHIEEGTIALKDVAEEIFDYLNSSDWDDFCDTYEHPETNADAFSDWLVDCEDCEWGSIFIVETDDKIFFCPIQDESDDYCRAEDLNNIVLGICGMYTPKNQSYDLSLNPSKPADFDPNMKHCEDKETAPAVDRITSPMFKPL